MQEKNIMDAIKSGDEQEMQKIICRYSRLLWSIVGAVLSQVGTTEDMEECVADVFIDLWEHPQEYDESRGNLKAGCLSLPETKPLTAIAKKQRYRPFLWRKRFWRKKGCGAGNGKKRGASAALEGLTGDEREILLRRYVYQQKPKEMAVALALSVKQIENRLYRIKAKMRKRMEQEG